jgi:CubicO group peptidase (beta-lactamase class C family)
MKLWEYGYVGLDDLVINYVPQMDNNGKNIITMRNLLLHNAGFPPDHEFYPVDNNVTS